MMSASCVPALASAFLRLYGTLTACHSDNIVVLTWNALTWPSVCAQVPSIPSGTRIRNLAREPGPPSHAPARTTTRHGCSVRRVPDLAFNPSEVLSRALTDNDLYPTGASRYSEAGRAAERSDWWEMAVDTSRRVPRCILVPGARYGTFWWGAGSWCFRNPENAPVQDDIAV